MPKCPGSGWPAVPDHSRLSWRYDRFRPPILWTAQWLLRLHGRRYDEQSMLIAGPAGIQQRLATVGLAYWAVAPTVP